MQSLLIYIITLIISYVVLWALFGYRYREIASGKIEVPRRKLKQEEMWYVFSLQLLHFEEKVAYELSKIVRRIKNHDWGKILDYFEDNPIMRSIHRRVEQRIRKNMIEQERTTSEYFKTISEHKQKIRNGNNGDEELSQ